ncbi:MAG: 3-phosphoshikimate 1-carboxyvinyltransferase [Actinomycetota bacterium]
MTSEQIAITCLAGPVNAIVYPPGSKSFTNRALVTAALANGVSRLHDPLDADDTLAMREGLMAFGVSIDDNDDPWLILGSGGELVVPDGPINARLSGTTARFLGAVAALVDGPVTIVAEGRMRTRPIEELVTALASAGVKASSGPEGLPLEVRGTGKLRGGKILVDPARSSQFVTALLLIAPMASEPVELVMTSEPVSASYLTSTLEVMKAFGATVGTDAMRFMVEPTGYRAAHYEIEADASAAVYPLVAAAITAGTVGVKGIPEHSTQPDLALVDVLKAMGCQVERSFHRLDLAGPEQLMAVDVDMNHAPDASLALAVACLFADGECRIRNIGNLRLKESNRLAALETELRRVGGSAKVIGDDLLVGPGRLRPAIVETYGDHRMAMAFALVGLRQPGIIIDNPQVVEKTWPRYFEMLPRL